MVAFGSTFLLAGVAIYAAATREYSPDRGTARDWISLGHGAALIVVAVVLFVTYGATMFTILTAVAGLGVLAVGAYSISTS